MMTAALDQKRKSGWLRAWKIVRGVTLGLALFLAFILAGFVLAVALRSWIQP